jgi:putative selenate reductase
LPASTRLKQVQFAKHEAKRCLDCSYICNKCVDVCPNRANVAIDVRHRSDLFEHPFQIVHLDALCNECGNCATFCPWDGKPYRDKLTVFNMKVDFDDSQNDGFFVDGDVILARFAKHVTECTIGRDGVIDGNLPPEILAIIEEIVSVHPYLLGRVEW